MVTGRGHLKECVCLGEPPLPCTPCRPPSRLPKYQDCHEMWSRRRRKKEGKEPGNVPPPGKPQLDGYPSSQPSSRPQTPPPPAPKADHPQPHHKPPVQQPAVAPLLPHNPSLTGYPSRPLIVPAAAVQKPATMAAQKPQVLANPNLKPSSLTVPLPTAPLSANILDSLTVQEGSSVPSGDGSLLGPSPPHPHNSANPHTAQQLHKVIEAQRSLLSQLTQLAESKHHLQHPPLEPPRALIPPCSGGVFNSRTQTFDYGNQSNKELEKVAVERLEREYFHDSW